MHAFLQDFNDNAPQFVRPPRGNLTVRISENASLGSQVLIVRAVDVDAGRNGQVK